MDAVKTWTNQLVDLGGRNQLLYYRDLKVGTLDFLRASPDVLGALLDGRAVRLSQLFEADLLQENIKRVRAIRNRSREAQEERGIAICFIAIGMATWTNTQGAAVPSAPVLLREASIHAVGAAEDDFELVLTGEPEINPTLAHLLREQFDAELPSDIDDFIEPGQFDPQPLFDRICKEASNVPGFGITLRQILGTFSYAKLPMVEDLNGNLEALISHDIVAAMAGDQTASTMLSAAGSDVRLTDPDHTPRLRTNTSSSMRTRHRTMQSTPPSRASPL